MIHGNKKLLGFFGMVAILLAGPVLASSYTGPVGTLRFSVGNGVTYTSIYTTQATACGNSGWYAVSNADTGSGKLYSAALLAAQAQGKTVTIGGFGTCNEYGIENVRYVDVF